MVVSIELQVISKILSSDNLDDVSTLCSYDASYYSIYREHIEFILDHKLKHGSPPDIFTFQAMFENVTLVKVSEPITYLTTELVKNKQHILLIETFNKLKDLGAGDVSEAWEYLEDQCRRVSSLNNSQPLDIVKQAHLRSSQVIEFSKQARIPTGFKEIDKLMYGGLSTVEELVILLARTNTGKSWVCTKMMESAQKNGFPVLYYSPEMQSSFLATRFDTWRGHFENSKIYRGDYSSEYYEYIKSLSAEETSAFIMEDKDSPEGSVNVPLLRNFVQKHSIKLLIVDGLSYVSDSDMHSPDHVRYKNICNGLFRLSKEFGCAVVVAAQANRESRETKDEKGEVFPTLYNLEGSDHPGRIATQAFSMRQIFDKHVLDIRLEKSRNAANQKPVLTYSWDPNTGNMQYVPGDAPNSTISSISPTIQFPSYGGGNQDDSTGNVSVDSGLDLDDMDDVEF